MKKLLIADDEPRQRRGLARLVQSLRPDLTVLEAANGQEALRIAQEEGPDAVLSDIRMPMVDGFELGEKLLEQKPDIVVAYVSAYEDFQYAARALRMGAVEYLLKPYTPEQVQATLAALEQHVQKRQKMQQAYQKLDHTLDAWREQRLMALLTRALTSEERADMAGIVPIDGGGYVLIAQVVDEDLEIWSADDSLETREQLKNWLVSLLPGLICCPLSEESLSLAGIYPGSLPAAELEARLQALLRDMARGFPVHVLIALSDQMQNIAGDAEHAYKQARFALSFRFFNPEGGLIPYHTVAPLRSRELPYLFRYEQMLLQKLTDATEEGLDGLLDEMFTYLNAQMRYAPEKLLRRLYQVSQSMISGIESRLPEMAFAHLWADAAAVFSEVNTYAQLKENFRQLMHAAVTAQMRERSEHTEEHILSSIAYIREHFAQPLTLSELGERFYFSPNYLSALIKSRTGVPFKQYLQTIRMEEAMERLRTSDDKVADIAQAVGFSDPAYFNRIFKKQYGVSPDSYRRNVKSRLSGGAQT
jgi:two-component system response regulator YesN